MADRDTRRVVRELCRRIGLTTADKIPQRQERVSFEPAPIPSWAYTFDDHYGTPVPVPHTCAWRPGIRTLQQCVEEYGYPAEILKFIWRTRWGMFFLQSMGMLPADESRKGGASMNDFLFARRGQELVPVLPRSDRQPDGVKFLTDAQCAAELGCTVEECRAEWISFYRSAD